MPIPRSPGSSLAGTGSVPLAELVERRPPLPLVRHVLALVLADRAGGRRLGALRILHRTRAADPVGHHGSPNVKGTRLKG